MIIQVINSAQEKRKSQNPVVKSLNLWLLDSTDKEYFYVFYFFVFFVLKVLINLSLTTDAKTQLIPD